MTTEEAKAKAVACGSVEIDRGVYLETGRQVLDDTEAYRDALTTDRITDDYDAQDIALDQLYILTDGYFEGADDEDIERCLNRN